MGGNFRGELGDGTTDPSTTPVDVTGLSGAIDVQVGETHGCALLASGFVWCWGTGSAGQLGHGLRPLEQPTPVQVMGISDAVQIAVGALHSCAVRRTGEVMCWGDDSTGQLGDGTTTIRPIPVQTTALTTAVAIAAGYSHSCALLVSGEVYCFGFAGSGALGDGQLEIDRPLPQLVMGLDDAIQIDASATGENTCVLRRTGEIACWGLNDCGQLTIATTPSAVPVPFTGLP